MPKKGRRTERGAAPGPDSGGFGGDEDYDWIKYLGEGRSAAALSSPATAAPPVAVRPQPRAAAAPPARPVAPSRSYEDDGDPRSDGDTDPRGGAPIGSDPYAGLAQVRGITAPRRAIGTDHDDWPRRGELQDPGDGTGPMQQSRRRSRAERGSGPDARVGNGAAKPSRETADERRPPGTGKGRAVKVRPGSATDLLFNPAAEEYDQPLYAPSSDYGQPPPGPRPDDPFVSPPRQLETAEYAQPLYPAFNSGPATDARPRRAWPDDDPLADTDARGRSAAFPGQAQRGDHTGPQRRIARPGDFDALTGPERVDRTGPQGRVDGSSRPDPLTDSGIGVLWSSELESPPLARSASTAAESAIADAPARRASTGPLDRLALVSPEALAEPPVRPGPAPAAPVRPARKARKGGDKAGKAKPKTSPVATKPGKGGPRPGRRRRIAALLVGCLLIAAASAAYGYFELTPRSSHTVTAPAALGAFSRQQANATAKDLKHRILSAGAGDVKNVVAAVYEQKTGPGTSNGPQVVVFIGGNLTGNASAGDLISAYMARLHNAFTTSPGGLGGQAGCAPGSNGSPAECAWADGDTFGVLVSATLSARGLADEMRQMRPLVEHVIK